MTYLFVGLVALAGICSTGCQRLHWQFTCGRCGTVNIPVPVDHQVGPMEAHPLGGQIMPHAKEAMSRTAITSHCNCRRADAVKADDSKNCPD